jgi:hypothetical protein
MLSTYPASVVIRSYSPWFVLILTGVTKVRNPREEDSASYPWFVARGFVRHEENA